MSDEDPTRLRISEPEADTLLKANQLEASSMG